MQVSANNSKMLIRISHVLKLTKSQHSYQSIYRARVSGPSRYHGRSRSRSFAHVSTRQMCREIGFIPTF